MSDGFPKYSRTAQQGDAGVNLVAQIVNDEFHWLFKRNPQEHDFGIDGQIEIISDDGSVTGQLIAVQVKHGQSYLREKNRWGYVYRGEMKHFNYLSNYPMPVLIVIGDPQTKEVYWVRFQSTQTRVSANGWALTVPFENRLLKSKAALLELVGPTVDRLAALQAYWKLNRLLVEAAAVLYIIDPDDLRRGNVTRSREFFDRLRATKELALECQGKVELVFCGFDDDPREVFEIPEVRKYVASLDRVLPELFFFASTGARAQTLKVFVSCLCEAKWDGQRSPTGGMVSLDSKRLGKFLNDHFSGLNKMTTWLGMSVEENKRISFAVAETCGLDLP